MNLKEISEDSIFLTTCIVQIYFTNFQRIFMSKIIQIKQLIS